MLNKFLNDNKAIFYALFRIIIGVLFFMHGAQKFGLLEGSLMMPGSTMMLLAGLIELIAGVVITLGLYTQIAAFISGIQMLYAFIFVHTFGSGFNIDPFTNGGEKALLFLAAFLVISTMGPGIWSLKQKK